MTEAEVAGIVDGLPRRLSSIRGLALIEGTQVECNECPACGGVGRLVDQYVVDCCPLCKGFRQVPRTVEEWFESHVREEPCKANKGSKLFKANEYDVDEDAYCPHIYHVPRSQSLDNLRDGVVTWVRRGKW